MPNLSGALSNAELETTGVLVECLDAYLIGLTL
jgi:hypothetical protein